MIEKKISKTFNYKMFFTIMSFVPKDIEYMLIDLKNLHKKKNASNILISSRDERNMRRKKSDLYLAWRPRKSSFPLNEADRRTDICNFYVKLNIELN